MLTHAYAQTNLQLFVQLQKAGYSETDLICIANAYKLGCRLFTGAFRGSGKPFLAHLIGTASILVTLQRSTPTIAAGLLHAAYELGDFGDATRGMLDWKRSQVQQAVGKEIEFLVAQYHTFKWNGTTIAQTYSCIDQLTVNEQEILIMRLANELEDHLDLGVLYCGNLEQRLDYIRNSRDRMVEIAALLELPTLSEALEKTLNAALAVKIPSALVSTHAYSYRIPTTSPIQQWKRRAAALFG